MGFFEAISSGYRHYADFSGRARRSEYWFFHLYNVIAIVAPALLGFALLMPRDGHEVDAKFAGGEITIFLALSVLMVFVNFLPHLALGVRRIHDTGQSGWWVLLGFIPSVGGLILLVWFMLPGTAGDNPYGPDPLSPPGPVA